MRRRAAPPPRRSPRAATSSFLISSRSEGWSSPAGDAPSRLPAATRRRDARVAQPARASRRSARARTGCSRPGSRDDCDRARSRSRSSVRSCERCSMKKRVASTPISSSSSSSVTNSPRRLDIAARSAPSTRCTNCRIRHLEQVGVAAERRERRLQPRDVAVVVGADAAAAGARSRARACSACRRRRRRSRSARRRSARSTRSLSSPNVVVRSQTAPSCS